MHGKDPGLTKSQLAKTVESGREIEVTDTVNWSVGDEILLTTTDYNPWHSEVFRISRIKGKKLTLNTTIKYRHIGELYLYSIINSGRNENIYLCIF